MLRSYTDIVDDLVLQRTEQLTQIMDGFNELVLLSFKYELPYLFKPKQEIYKIGETYLVYLNVEIIPPGVQIKKILITTLDRHELVFVLKEEERFVDPTKEEEDKYAFRDSGMFISRENWEKHIKQLQYLLTSYTKYIEDGLSTYVQIM